MWKKRNQEKGGKKVGTCWPGCMALSLLSKGMSPSGSRHQLEFHLFQFQSLRHVSFTPQKAQRASCWSSLKGRKKRGKYELLNSSSLFGADGMWGQLRSTEMQQLKLTFRQSRSSTVWVHVHPILEQSAMLVFPPKIQSARWWVFQVTHGTSE